MHVWYIHKHTHMHIYEHHIIYGTYTYMTYENTLKINEYVINL